MRKIILGEVKGEEVSVDVTPEAEKVAREAREKLDTMVASLKTRFGHGMKLNISQEALEDLVAVHGADAVVGLDRDMEIDVLTSAAFEGNRAAYDELLNRPEGRVRVDQMKIRKP